MRVWQVHETGEPGTVLVPEETDPPTPGPGQIRVRVRAAAVNFADVLLCRGRYQVRPPLPFTPGVELCGEVVELGTGVSAPAIGSRVIGLSVLPHGAFAEYTLMAAEAAQPAPEQLGDAEASALYIGYQTGWFGLHRRAAIAPGEVLLVHAAAGGVGSAAVQLGSAAGATVIGVVGSAAKVAVARQAGADIVVVRDEEDFVEVVREVTGGRGADVVFDPVGGDAYTRSTKCIAFEGRIVVVGFAGGVIPQPGLNHALVKNYSILGLHWGLYVHRDPTAVAAAHRELSRLAAQGVVRPRVTELVGLADTADALQRLADGHTVGRLVIDPSR
ncbi:NADPH:quinone oxidoreductase family protein [Actinoalloteichus hymeniacidonis]|uniref:Zn-dependent oxidoreductase, NADPH:quinone reductase n=1 Tax=Actinoalloteichus hymeniacidonis TaxID=340345 RepID=A0AAC9HRU0_9PSEU|nr:NADPH:quinone oxidoreductase family protein [Actinoalloteichus hymeniacidonis]AOS63335.1 Zn-dependent oxidoreductase, NADPH:quinone reductase [Actinoalloteichus hymeniacidonis]MBB5908626.1 NADPH2:quinone reductase [Actinoalloteichus hymeniacidonis]